MFNPVHLNIALDICFRTFYPNLSLLNSFFLVFSCSLSTLPCQENRDGWFENELTGQLVRRRTKASFERARELARARFSQETVKRA